MRLVESLDSEDLVSLIKSLTIGEREFTGWKSGSVSPVIRLFRKLCDVNSTQADTLAPWIFDHTDNPYLPWEPTLSSAKSLAEFQEFERGEWKGHAARQAELRKKEEARRRNAEKRSRNLFVAISSNEIRGVEALINRGAYDKHVVVDGITAIEFAETKGNKEIIELLRAAEANA